MKVSAPPPGCGRRLSTVRSTATQGYGRRSLRFRAMTAPRHPGRPRVLVISAGPVGAVMSGPGIRAFELARALEPYGEVTLAATDPEDGTPSRSEVGVVFRQQDPRALRPHIMRADVILSQPPWPMVAAWCRRSAARLVYDLYDPEPLEMLAHREAGGGTGARSARLDRILIRLWETLTLDRVLDALHDGHHFVCASEKQRDLWVGTMMSERLLTHSVHARDPSLRSVLDTVPFGVPTEPARHTGSDGIRGRFPAIAHDDEIVLWNGGIWNWLDAPTAVRAMTTLTARRPRAKLVFMGHSSDINGRRAAAEARATAQQEGLLDHSVFFNDRWVPYEQRGDWLLEADCAVSTHAEHLETRFAFRTRVLDCFWARLPIVCTAGDDLAARVERDALGAVVAPGRADALADALAAVLARGRQEYAEALARAAADHAWSAVAGPIARYITSEERPPRLGSPGPRRPLRYARTTAFRLSRSALNAVGLSHWPKL